MNEDLNDGFWGSYSSLVEIGSGIEVEDDNRETRGEEETPSILFGLFLFSQCFCVFLSK